VELLTKREKKYIEKYHPEVELSMSGHNKKSNRKKYFATEDLAFWNAMDEYYNSIKQKRTNEI